MVSLPVAISCQGSFSKSNMQNEENNKEKGVLNQLLSEQGIKIEGLDKAIAKCKKNINRYKNRPNKLKNFIAKLEKFNEIEKIKNQMGGSHPNDTQYHDPITTDPRSLGLEREFQEILCNLALVEEKGLSEELNSCIELRKKHIEHKQFQLIGEVQSKIELIEKALSLERQISVLLEKQKKEKLRLKIEEIVNKLGINENDLDDELQKANELKNKHVKDKQFQLAGEVQSKIELIEKAFSLRGQISVLLEKQKKERLRLKIEEILNKLGINENDLDDELQKAIELKNKHIKKYKFDLVGEVQSKIELIGKALSLRGQISILLEKQKKEKLRQKIEEIVNKLDINKNDLDNELKKAIELKNKHIKKHEFDLVGEVQNKIVLIEEALDLEKKIDELANLSSDSKLNQKIRELGKICEELKLDKDNIDLEIENDEKRIQKLIKEQKFNECHNISNKLKKLRRAFLLKNEITKIEKRDVLTPPDVINPQTWYSQDNIKHLLHAFNSYQIIRYSMLNRNENTMDSHLKQLKLLRTVTKNLNLPALFISFEPRHVSTRHYVLGMLLGNNLLYINPLGRSSKNEEDFLELIFKIKDIPSLECLKIYSSTTIFQNDPLGSDVSCGPIVLEIAKKILQKNISLKELLEDSKETGNCYTDVSLKKYFPELNKLKNSTKENYEKRLVEIRKEHRETLTNLKPEKLKYVSNSIEQVCFYDYLKQKTSIKTILNSLRDYFKDQEIVKSQNNKPTIINNHCSNEEDDVKDDEKDIFTEINNHCSEEDDGKNNEKDTFPPRPKRSPDPIIGYIKKLPPCTEKIILSLILYLKDKKNNSNQNIDQNYIDESFKQIFKFIIGEELGNYYNIKSFINEAQVEAESKHWKKAKDKLKIGLKEIRPFDIQQTLTLVDKALNASKKVYNKDIILFLGGTGVGKSTTIHFFAGSKFKKIKIAKKTDTKTRMLDHLQPIEIKNKYLKDVKTSAKATSETRYITAVPVMLKDLGLRKANLKEVILCDTPGFEDTNGPEVDVANGIGIVEAVKNCRTVKPIILMSPEGEGYRMKGLRNIASLIVCMIKNFDANVNAISYIFNKYEKSKIENTKTKIVDLFENLNSEEKRDPFFCCLFEDMVRKIDNEEIIFLDPLKDNPKHILNKFIESKKIKNPEDNFRFSICDKSLLAIKDQLHIHEQFVKTALLSKNYELLNYKLSEINKLYSILERNFIKEAYKNSRKILLKGIETDLNQIKYSFNKCLQDYNSLTENDINEYKDLLNEFQNNIESKMKSHIDKSYASGELNENLESQINILFHKSINEGSTFALKTIDEEILKARLKKIKIISASFENVKISDIYNKIQNSLQVEADNLVFQIKNSNRNNDFKNLNIQVIKLGKFLENYKEHLADPESIEANFEDQKARLQNTLESNKKEISELLNMPNLRHKQISNLKEKIELIEDFNKTSLIEIFSKGLLNNFYQEIIESIIDKFKDISLKIDGHFKAKETSSYKKIKNLLDHIEVLRDTSEVIKTNSSLIYNEILQKLPIKIQQTRIDIESILNNLVNEQRSIKVDTVIDFESIMQDRFKILAEHLEDLKDSSWIDERLNDAICEETLKRVSKDIINYARIIESIVRNSKVDKHDNYKKIIGINNKVVQVRCMKPLEEYVQGLSEIIKKVEDYYRNQILHGLKSIELDCD